MKAQPFIRISKTAVLVFYACLATPALADEDDAIRTCEQRIQQEYDVDKFRDVWADKEGHHKYRVYGKVKTNDHKYPFNCKIKSGEVKSYAYEGPHSKDSDGAAIAVGAGIAIVAAALIASGDEDDGDSEQLQHRRSHIEDDCQDELSYRIRDEHNRTANVTLKSADLEGFDLVGEARVKYEGHHPHQATYRCHFDKRGYLIDSRYELH